MNVEDDLDRIAVAMRRAGVRRLELGAGVAVELFPDAPVVAPPPAEEDGLTDEERRRREEVDKLRMLYGAAL